jgi:hypothetical protein
VHGKDRIKPEVFCHFKPWEYALYGVNAFCAFCVKNKRAILKLD